MIGITIKIISKVDNLTLSEIYGLLQKYSLDKIKDNKIYVFKGLRFKIETSIDTSINYIITELK